RPYHVENTGSRPITEVKQRRAWLVLRWVTAWEHHVLRRVFVTLRQPGLDRGMDYKPSLICLCCLRPYHVENTGSRPITEVKQRRAWLVLRWVTAWEHHVL
ncbi:hypothetical protein EGW08_023707, partial [Elysia chlorotica]